MLLVKINLTLWPEQPLIPPPKTWGDLLKNSVPYEQFSFYIFCDGALLLRNKYGCITLRVSCTVNLTSRNRVVDPNSRKNARCWFCVLPAILNRSLACGRMRVKKGDHEQKNRWLTESVGTVISTEVYREFRRRMGEKCWWGKGELNGLIIDVLTVI